MAELSVHWAETYPVGAHAFVGGDAVNLRETAALDGKVAAELPLGEPVEVLEVGASTTVGTRTASWLRIRAAGHEGWVFGGLLTPARLVVDLDGDGKSEVAVL